VRPVIGALPLLASIVLASLPVTLASFNATTSLPNNAFTNLVVQPGTLSAPVTAAAGVVQLSWTASPTAGATYAVLRSPSGLATWTSVATLAGLSYSDTPPSDGLWDYEILAFVAAFTATSNLQTGRSDGTAPSAATAVTAATGSVKGTIGLTWTAGTDAGSGVSGYTVRFVQATTCPAASISAYPNAISVGAVTVTTVTGLATAKTYCFYLITSDAAGNTSGASNLASAKAK
jgi:hypothetical protein